MEGETIKTQEEGVELSYGERAVGLMFNPAGDPKVDEIKKLYSKIIDILNDSIHGEMTGEQVRLHKVAITEAQSAQMWAVKGITYKY